MDMVETISEVVGIPFKDTFMNLSMKKDNKRRLVLEDTIKLQFKGLLMYLGYHYK